MVITRLYSALLAAVVCRCVLSFRTAWRQAWRCSTAGGLPMSEGAAQLSGQLQAGLRAARAAAWRRTGLAAHRGGSLEVAARPPAVCERYNQHGS